MNDKIKTYIVEKLYGAVFDKNRYILKKASSPREAATLAMPSGITVERNDNGNICVYQGHLVNGGFPARGYIQPAKGNARLATRYFYQTKKRG